MALKRRIDLFFILYLTAIVGFVVVSRERDRIDDEMNELNEHIVRTLLPPAPVLAESDTLRCYVDADSSGIVIGSPQVFRTKVFVQDIGPNDAISMTLHSVIHDGTLSTPEMVSLGLRTGTGNIEDHTVYFPVSCVFPRTGLYNINLSVRSDRIHEWEAGRFHYRGISFDTTMMSREMIRAVEHTGTTLTILVVDTSLSQTSSLQPIALELNRTSITSSVGFEERNSVIVNLGWARPTVSIARGGGKLKEVSRTDRLVEFLWSGTVGSLPDTVMIEARTNRQAGGKDIAIARFAVNGVPPFLRGVSPEHLFAGEDVSFDISVDGLNDPAQYSWRLNENVSRTEQLLKTEGRGPRVAYRIPNSYAGKTLIIDARYNGRTYRYLSRDSYASGNSRFEFAVIAPPTQIEFQLPSRSPASSSFRFSASRYNDIRFRGEQPVDKLSDVRVELNNERGEALKTEVWMIRKGEFEFSLENRNSIRKGGERVTVRILSAGSSEQRSMQLY
ncbi:MAG: hypothetical protein WBQ23_10470 [Bacteroidota bacterium]